MKNFGNRAIAASAGTGKTWALAHRYLALMAAGVDPDRICALTFSRKAAGEIFETIVDRLCRAATDDTEREATRRSAAAQAAGVAAPAQAREYVRLLRQLLDRSHRLRIGTLDSFMLGIVRAFPLELGVPPDTRPMDNEGGEARAHRQALLTRLYDPGRRLTRVGGNDAGTALLEAFRQATYGREAKSLSSRLDLAIVQRYDFYRRHVGKTWGGEADRIWTPGTQWWQTGGEAARREAGTAEYQEALRQAFGDKAVKLGEACAKIAAAGAAYTAERVWPGDLSKVVFAQLLTAAPNPDAPTLAYSRKDHSLPPSLWPPLRAALGNLVAVEIARALQQTAGLRAMLAGYDALYREAQRTDGGLTFSDLSRLLAEPAHRPSREADAADKLYVDYRLDGRLDHWLLDEFQDTSDDQWQAIANLIDEVVQDPARSFFYVGDIKQSIYGWRSGNWRLFDRVRNACGIRDLETMADCHRSPPAIVATVNAVFGDLPSWQPAAGEKNGPHPRAVADFVGKAWPVHRSATDKSKGDGFAALIEYAPKKRHAGEDADNDAEGSDDPAQYEAVADILKDTRPVPQGLSVAVLVRGNDQGRQCADVLRRRLPGTAVVHEGVGGIVDNPVVTLLLALVRFASHPADTLARRHLEMSPLAPLDSNLSVRLLSDIHEMGFAGALRAWGERLAGCGALQPDDAFGQQRLREFLAAAAEFDATGSRDADAFADHVRSHQVKSQAAAGAVRVMTVHQSKGLGFDVVLVPFDPAARSFRNMSSVRLLRSDCGANPSTSLRGAEPAPDGWVLQMPKTEALQAAGGPPVDAFDAARAEANFEQLCVLYVSLTRAKRALYMLVPERSETSTSVREADLLRERLAGDDAPQSLATREQTQERANWSRGALTPAGRPEGRPAPRSAKDCGASPGTRHGLTLLYARGDDGWHTRPAAPTAVKAVPAAPATVCVTFVPEVKRREPSKEYAEGRALPARWLFSEEAGDVPAFGTALHRLFQRIEWIEDADIEGLVAAWRAEALESAAVQRDVEAQFRSCLAQDEARACLSRPSGAAPSEVWREASFSLVRDGKSGPEIVSGRFDRLVVERDAAGRPVRATVVDFKSNRLQTDAALADKAGGYAGQMRDYAAAAARLLEIDARQVAAIILFTRAGRAWQV